MDDMEREANELLKTFVRCLPEFVDQTYNGTATTFPIDNGQVLGHPLLGDFASWLRRRSLRGNDALLKRAFECAEPLAASENDIVWTYVDLELVRHRKWNHSYQLAMGPALLARLEASHGMRFT